MRKKSSPSSYGDRSAGQRSGNDEGKRRSFDKDSKPYKRKERGEAGEKPFRSEGRKDDDRPKRSFPGREDKPSGFKRSADGNDRPKRSFEKREGGYKKDFGKDRPGRSSEDGGNTKRPYPKKDGYKKDFGSDRPLRSSEEGDAPKRPYPKKEDFKREGSDDRSRRSFGKKDDFRKDKKTAKPERPERDADAPAPSYDTPHKYKRADSKNAKAAPKPLPEFSPKGKPVKKRKTWDEDDEDIEETEDQPMTLNKYIAHSGECSRRDAAELIKQGKVKVNGELVTTPGYRVQEMDMVTLLGKKLVPHITKAYILLNKPKGFITTTEDPQERKTVMDLVENAGIDRLYPVGRLDRNTTGLLLLTNDGDLAQKLSHPSYAIKKVYQASLDKPLTKAHFNEITEGIMLEDGMAQVDELAYLDDKKEIGLEIHSGRNRIVRRIFESLGYQVEKLDRVMYAGLTKKNLPRGKWRFLTEKEIILLKHFKV